MTATFDKIFTDLPVISYIALLFIINAKLTLVVFLVFPVLGFLISSIGKAVGAEANEFWNRSPDCFRYSTKP